MSKGRVFLIVGVVVLVGAGLFFAHQYFLNKNYLTVSEQAPSWISKIGEISWWVKGESTDFSNAEGFADVLAQILEGLNLQGECAFSEERIDQLKQKKEIVELKFNSPVDIRVSQKVNKKERNHIKTDNRGFRILTGVEKAIFVLSGDLEGYVLIGRKWQGKMSYDCWGIKKEKSDEIDKTWVQDIENQIEKVSQESKQEPKIENSAKEINEVEKGKHKNVSETAPKEEKYQRQEISFLKFVSSENCMYSLDDSEIAELKSLNVNGIRICPLYGVQTDGNIREDVPEFVIINLIKKAHQAGLAVFLEPNLAGPGGFPDIKDPKYINQFYDISLHWIEIAEKENVEFFSPLNEPNATFAMANLVNQWIEKSQDLRPEFSGSLVLKLADIGPAEIGDISRYDYLAFDLMWGGGTLTELKNYLNLAANKGNKIKNQQHLKGFFFGELGGDRRMIDKNSQTEYFKAVFENTWGKVDGYCFLGWSNLEFHSRDNKEAKEIIKTWYAKMIKKSE